MASCASKVVAVFACVQCYIWNASLSATGRKLPPRAASILTCEASGRTALSLATLQSYNGIHFARFVTVSAALEQCFSNNTGMYFDLRTSLNMLVSAGSSRHYGVLVLDCSTNHNRMTSDCTGAAFWLRAKRPFHLQFFSINRPHTEPPEAYSTSTMGAALASHGPISHPRCLPG
jgi:hypothetical protein